MRIAATAMLLALAAGCKEKAADPFETPNFLEWKRSQVARRMSSAGAPPSERVRVTLGAPGPRAARPGEFLELYVNGERFGKWTLDALPGGRLDLEVPLRTGPNWLDLWDSSSDRHCREQVDTRRSVDFTFMAAGDGYELQQVQKP